MALGINSPSTMGTLADWRDALRSGEVTATELASKTCNAANYAKGEGRRVYVSRNDAAFYEAAGARDGAVKKGAVEGPLGGLPISIKDLFDVKGEVTTAGSVLLRDRPPAQTDSEAVRRMRAAGALITGRTTMTEFAYSGLGLNPHTGTPLNPYDRDNARIPGGSSSGAVVSVTDGMALAAIGSDTGGSLRIPAALCGVVGFKPTQSRMPMEGVFPLSTSLDTIGPIARSVACCARIDAVLAGEGQRRLRPRRPDQMRLAVLDRYVVDGLDDKVARAYLSALETLDQAGAALVKINASPLERIASINASGGFAAGECYALLGQELRERPEAFDPRVAARIAKGAGMTASEYTRMCQERHELMVEMAALVADFDAIICPTVPRIAPRIAALKDDDEYDKINLLMLRNPSVANLLDRPAISVPCHPRGAAPVGLMLIGHSQEDHALLDLAAGVEALLLSCRK
jgi:aspartyl-tRNA(Asn)/glutamyl-tRNA(Gln) amidotransferase subunit A